MAGNTEIITEQQLLEQQNHGEAVRQYWQDRGIHPTAYIDTYGCQQNEADSEPDDGDAPGDGLSPGRMRPRGRT